VIETTDAAMARAEHIIRNRDDLVELLRARKAQIGLSNAYVEHALHMGAGGCDKLLAQKASRCSWRSISSNSSAADWYFKLTPRWKPGWKNDGSGETRRRCVDAVVLA
jgi:hypothetical protein